MEIMWPARNAIRKIATMVPMWSMGGPFVVRLVDGSVGMPCTVGASSPAARIGAECSTRLHISNLNDKDPETTDATGLATRSDSSAADGLGCPGTWKLSVT
jgi:hypothetical protein